MAESIHETNSQGLTQETSQQRLIRREKLVKLQEEGNDPFQITRYVVDNDSANIKEHFDALEGGQVSIAGRLMSNRGMGKVSFYVPHPAGGDVRPGGACDPAEQVPTALA